jgi:hypothetical protein
VRFALWASYGWFLLMGLLVPGFVLTWTVAKEVNRPEHAGMATSVVNVGIFLGTGILQPLIGWLLDRGRAAGTLGDAYSLAVTVLFGAAVAGFVAALFVRTKR